MDLQSTPLTQIEVQDASCRSISSQFSIVDEVHHQPPGAAAVHGANSALRRSSTTGLMPRCSQPSWSLSHPSIYAENANTTCQKPLRNDTRPPTTAPSNSPSRRLDLPYTSATSLTTRRSSYGLHHEPRGESLRSPTLFSHSMAAQRSSRLIAATVILLPSHPKAFIDYLPPVIKTHVIIYKHY